MHTEITRLNDKRIKLQISTYRISKETNISMQTLRNIFKGRTEPRVGFYFAIKEYLDKF